MISIRATKTVTKAKQKNRHPWCFCCQGDRFGGADGKTKVEALSKTHQSFCQTLYARGTYDYL